MYFFPVQNVFLPRAKCISSDCKMHFFRLRNEYCISSHYKKLSFIFYFEINPFHTQNVVLSRVKCFSSPWKIYFFRLQNMQNVFLPNGKCSSLPFPTNCIYLLLFHVSMYSMYSSSLQSGYSALAKCLLPFMGETVKFKYACVEKLTFYICMIVHSITLDNLD